MCKLSTPCLFQVHEVFMAQLETPTTRRIVTFTLYPVKHDLPGPTYPVSQSKRHESPTRQWPRGVRLTVFVRSSYKHCCRPANSADEVFTQVLSVPSRNPRLRESPVRPGAAKEIPGLHGSRQRLRQCPRSADQRETRTVAHRFREYDRDSDRGRYGHVIGGPPYRRIRQRALPRLGRRRE